MSNNQISGQASSNASDESTSQGHRIIDSTTGQPLLRVTADNQEAMSRLRFGRHPGTTSEYGDNTERCNAPLAQPRWARQPYLQEEHRSGSAPPDATYQQTQLSYADRMRSSSPHGSASSLNPATPAFMPFSPPPLSHQLPIAYQPARQPHPPPVQYAPRQAFPQVQFTPESHHGPAAPPQQARFLVDRGTVQFGLPAPAQGRDLRPPGWVDTAMARPYASLQQGPPTAPTSVPSHPVPAVTYNPTLSTHYGPIPLDAGLNVELPSAQIGGHLRRQEHVSGIPQSQDARGRGPCRPHGPSRGGTPGPANDRLPRELTPSNTTARVRLQHVPEGTHVAPGPRRAIFEQVQNPGSHRSVRWRQNNGIERDEGTGDFFSSKEEGIAKLEQLAAACGAVVYRTTNPGSGVTADPQDPGRPGFTQHMPVGMQYQFQGPSQGPGHPNQLSTEYPGIWNASAERGNRPEESGTTYPGRSSEPRGPNE